MTTAAALLDWLPLWGLAVALVMVLIVASELGFAAHRRFGKSGVRSADQDASDETQVLATALLLLALLLGFTFSMALSRHDTRRDQIVREANDIGTAWLRAGLTGNPAGAALQAKLAEYATTRVGHADIDHDAENAEAADLEMRRKGGALRREIWSLAAEATLPDRSTAQSAALIAAVNSVLDTATTRETAIAARVPSQVILLLMGYATISAFLLGYTLGAFHSHHRMATTLLFVLLATTIMLIVDLDRPQDGGIQVNQQPMIDLVAEIAPR